MAVLSLLSGGIPLALMIGCICKIVDGVDIEVNM